MVPFGWFTREFDSHFVRYFSFSPLPRVQCKKFKRNSEKEEVEEEEKKDAKVTSVAPFNLSMVKLVSLTGTIHPSFRPLAFIKLPKKLLPPSLAAM